MVRRPTTQEVRIHVEVTNLSEAAVSVAQWVIRDSDGMDRIAGSPYEGRVEGPDLLQPGQLHGFTIEPETVAMARALVPVVIELRLTTGESFRSEPLVNLDL